MKKIFLSFVVICFSACSSISAPPRTPSSVSTNFEKMNIQLLKARAFEKCQVPFKMPVTVPVPVLDPPKDGAPESEGMVYQEELSVRTSNFLDEQGFYFSPRPRAAVNTLPMDVFVQHKKTDLFEKKTWEDANVDYSSPNIKPKISKGDIPEAGRVLTELIVGHKSPDGGYPQLFDLRSSAYFRFAGYPPQVTGASMRLGAHKIFGHEADTSVGVKEDFPIVRSVYASINNSHIASALVIVENELFCGALSMQMTEGSNGTNDADVLVDSYWFLRENFDYKKDPNTALVLYSSMYWKTNDLLPNGKYVVAHDSDTIRVKSAAGVSSKYPIEPPAKGLRITDLSKDSETSEWTLSNEDHNPAHFAKFESALGNTNYNFRASYKVQILESNVKTGVTIYEQATDAEYGDNLVAASTLRQNVKKSQSTNDFIHFKYRTTSFYFR